MPRVYVRVIKPRQPFPPDRERAERELRTAARQVGEIAVRYHKEIVSSWKNQPDFGLRVKIDLDRAIEIFVFPKGDKKAVNIWGWLTKGTPAREIVPRKAKALSFETDYRPRTRPGGGYRGPGKAFGPRITVARVKRHEIKPRNFEKTVGRWLRQRKDVERILKNAMARAKRAL